MKKYKVEVNFKGLVEELHRLQDLTQQLREVKTSVHEQLKVLGITVKEDS